MSGWLNPAAWLAASLGAWSLAWWHLSDEWLGNEQYGYGIGIPPLALYLFIRRWHGPVAGGRFGPACAVTFAAGWLILALGELLRWHDPVWRLTGALLAAGATLVSVAALLRLGGTPLLRRELFPLLFAWTAVPWPGPLELAITLHLLHSVTTIVSDALAAVGIAALQHGNAIELASGVLGVDDACSGIRSLQAALMASLFLGAHFFLPISRRMILLLGGALLSFATNCLRIIALALVLHCRGPAVAVTFHDSIGAAATAAAFASVLALAICLNGKHPLRSPASVSQSLGATPGFDGAAACAAVVAAPLASWAWLSPSQAATPEVRDRFQWTLARSNLSPEWEASPVEPRPGERSALRFSVWEAFRIQSPEGWSAQVVHLGWARGKSMPSLAFYHTPALCMPSVGWTEVGKPVKTTLQIRAQRVPFAAYRFSQEGNGVLVLQSVSSAGRSEHHLVDPEHVADRWQRLFTHWKAPLREVTEELLVYLPDFGNEEAQTRSASAVLEALLARPTPPSPPRSNAEDKPDAASQRH